MERISVPKCMNLSINGAVRTCIQSIKSLSRALFSVVGLIENLRPVDTSVCKREESESFESYGFLI